MFSSTTNNVGPCLQVSSCENATLQYLSSYNQNNEIDNLLYHQSHLTLTNPKSRKDIFLIDMEVLSSPTMGIGDLQNGPSRPDFPSRKKSEIVKKDRDRKICTAKGLRERRVRLSNEIARDFFNLQDKLGFNKASKTIEWLLTKSKKAIDDLDKNGGRAERYTRSSVSTTCELALSETEGDVTEGVGSNKLLDGNVACQDEKKLKVQKSEIAGYQSKPRARARERARERTKMKMCNTKQFNLSKRLDLLEHDHSSMPLSQQCYFEVMKLGFSR